MSQPEQSEMSPEEVGRPEEEEAVPIPTGAELVAAARAFAEEAHGTIGHRRRYSGDPYITHLQAVARQVAGSGAGPEIVAAAWLHDVVQDTRTTLEEVQERFGDGVAGLVAILTGITRPEDGNRATRKPLDREQVAAAPPGAQTIKLADLIDNADSICRHDIRFGRIFLREMEELMRVLRHGDPGLKARAEQTWRDWRRKLGG
jgi:(p)ppGpp synthase/HD superfamily hydrolase